MSNAVFKGRKAILGTRHAKERVIAPVLERALGIEIVVPPDFDSDAFGTFTRDVKRAGDQLQAARAKAVAAMDLSGLDLGIASEGSFGPYRNLPVIPSNLELVLLVDRKHGLELQGYHRSFDTNLDGAYVASVEEALRHAERWGFPDHGVIVRDSDESNRHIEKELLTLEAFQASVRERLRVAASGAIYLETDMRAHRNPTRMRSIRRAAENLARNATSLCPACSAPGFAIAEVRGGVPCRWCRAPTDKPRSALCRCAKCRHEKEELLVGETELADPGLCSHCNP